MIFNQCQCCIAKLIDAIKNIKCNVEVPQPLNVNCNIPQPLPVSFVQPVEITGTVNSVSTDACAEAMAKILSQSSSFSEVVFDTAEQYQKVENLTVDGSIVSFESQGKKIQTTVCKIEYVVL